MVKLIDVKNTWLAIKNSALNTIGKEESEKEPSSEWKRKILLSEHSPIRMLKLTWKWIGIPYWVSVHFVRHKFGIEHWVKSQRTDRTGVDRATLAQGELVDHECEANAQSLINISRKRLCFQASKETRDRWIEVLDSIKESEPELYSVCVPECVYRNGFCPEYKTCGYNHTIDFENKLKEYIDGMESQINKNTCIK